MWQGKLITMYSNNFNNKITIKLSNCNVPQYKIVLNVKLFLVTVFARSLLRINLIYLTY